MPDKSEMQAVQVKPDSLKILIVDDSRLVLSFADRVLKDLGAPMDKASNGKEALELMGKSPADILITDIMMPKMDGFELIETIRANPSFEQTHIIVMTALDQVEDKVRALELGANDYTVKPLDANEFRARVQAGIRECQLKRSLTVALERLDQELKLVANLQRRLLPKSLPVNQGFEAAVYYQPWSRAGGDYYDCFSDGNGRVFIVVADVSGHGASAAVLMAMFRALLKTFADGCVSAGEVIQKLNLALLDNIGNDPDFISVFLAIWEKDQRRLNYCIAGHGDMILMGPQKGNLMRLEAGGTVLGCFNTSWREEYIGIEPGQTLVLYTDGIIEAVNENEEEFGRTRLLDILSGADPYLKPEKVIELIRNRLSGFTDDADFPDDLTLFVLNFD